VLYSHFPGKLETVGAVALEGFAELTTALRDAVPEEPAPLREAFQALLDPLVITTSHSP
jgi:hypothetical protein